MKYYERILRELAQEEHSFRTIYRHVFSFSDKVLFEYNRNLVIHRITYAEARTNVLRIYGVLKETIHPGEVVALQMKNSALWVECFWAVLMAGGTVFPITPEMPNKMAEECLKNAGCTLVLGRNVNAETRWFSESDLTGCKPDNPVNCEPQDGWGNEVILATSGTTGMPRLYAYTGSEICDQILNSNYVLKSTKDISRFWHGHLRQLAFLPFSHIFGLTACYLWFTIFGCTFVELENFAPSTILRTCRLHQVTHIWAVPIFWDSLANGILSEAEKTGQAEKLQKGMKLCLRLQDTFPTLGRKITARVMHSVQAKTLGQSISFCISGGGILKSATSEIINACGYHLENGYGMTEIGITGVSLNKKANDRKGQSVGRPFPSVEAKLNEEGHLLVRGKNCFAAQYTEGQRLPHNKNEWFDTGDCATIAENGEITISGRGDDLINNADGERIHPENVEALINLDCPTCVINLPNKGLALVVSAPKKFYPNREEREAFAGKVQEILGRIPSNLRPKHLLFTYDDLPVSLSYKYKRSAIANAVTDGGIRTMTTARFIAPEGTETLESELAQLSHEIASLMQEVLNTHEEVSFDSDFFVDLGGDSLSYIEFLSAVESRYQISIPQSMSACCTTPGSTARLLAGITKT